MVIAMVTEFVVMLVAKVIMLVAMLSLARLLAGSLRWLLGWNF